MTVTDQVPLRDGQVLLRDWELLQDEVVPGLLGVGPTGRPARCWSIGSIEDAVSIAVAYQHAGRAPGSDPMESYATTADHREIGFRSSDLRDVPDGSRQEYFVREDRRWLVDDRIAERVLLDDPSEPVDLVTFRGGVADHDFGVAVDQVRQDGRLLVIGQDTAQPRQAECLERVLSTPMGVVYRKRTPARARGRHRRSRDGHLVETLAHDRAQRRLVESHTKLAASLARRFAHHGEAADDLEQVAMLALLKAAQRFDPGRDTRFATYATASILGELKRHFRDKAWTMRVPRQLQENYLSVKQIRDELTQALGAEPTVQQIAHRLGKSASEVNDALGAGDNFWAVSLEGRFPDDEGTQIPVLDGSFDRALDRLQMQRRMGSLDRDEQLVLRRIFFDELTQREVATEMGISQMQVSRLQTRALSKLRG